MFFWKHVSIYFKYMAMLGISPWVVLRGCFCVSSHKFRIGSSSRLVVGWLPFTKLIEELWGPEHTGKALLLVERYAPPKRTWIDGKTWKPTWKPLFSILKMYSPTYTPCTLILTWLDGKKTTMNEDVFPIEHGDFPSSLLMETILHHLGCIKPCI